MGAARLKADKMVTLQADRRLIPVSDIDVEGMIRRPRPARVAAIAADIHAEGLRDAIEVTPRGSRWTLTHGWVRLQAHRLLARPQIEAVVWRGPAAERAARQVHLNLQTEGCTALDRARYLAAGKASYERLHPETRNGAAAWKKQSAKLGTLKPYWESAAELYGFSRRSTFRSLAIGEAIALAAVELLADTEWADNQTALESISRFAPEQQVEIALLITAEPARTLAEAVAHVGGAAPADPGKKAFSAALGGWSRLGRPQRVEYLREISKDLPSGVRIVFQGED